MKGGDDAGPETGDEMNRLAELDALIATIPGLTRDPNVTDTARVYLTRKQAAEVVEVSATAGAAMQAAGFVGRWVRVGGRRLWQTTVGGYGGCRPQPDQWRCAWEIRL